jgi:hypothetical protein
MLSASCCPPEDNSNSNSNYCQREWAQFAGPGPLRAAAPCKMTSRTCWQTAPSTWCSSFTYHSKTCWQFAGAWVSAVLVREAAAGRCWQLVPATRLRGLTVAALTSARVHMEPWGHHGPSSSRCQTALSHLKHEGLEEVHPVGDFALLTAPYQPGGLCMPFLVWHLGSPPLRQHVLQRGLPVGHGSNCCYNRDARGISLPAFMFTSPTLVFLGAHLCSHRELERGARDLHIHRQELCTLNLVCPNCVENTTRLAH